MILKTHIRHNGITRPDSVDLHGLLPAAGAHVHQNVLNVQGIVVPLGRSEKMHRLGGGDPPVLFPGPGPHNDGMGGQAGKVEAPQHQDAQKPVLQDGLYHKAAFVQMGVQHNNRTSLLPVLHGRIHVVHGVVFHVQSPAPVLHLADDLFLKTAGTEGVGQRLYFFNVCHHYLQAFPYVTA